MGKKLFALIKVAYCTILRPLVVEKVKDSASKIDDIALSLLDKIFDYNEDGQN